MTNPYVKFVSDYANLLKAGESYKLGGYPPAGRPVLPADAPRVLLFSPHPDDECITGALPLRLLRELKMNVINVAVTLGSRKERRLGRLEELRQACDYLGFGLVRTRAQGLEKINAQTRKTDPQLWADAVGVIADIVRDNRPHTIFLPHDQDWNSTHIGTHLLVMDALKTLDGGFCCRLCETEYWAPMASPNLMIESSVADVADLVTATSFHVEEVKRNPYHLRLPAWMKDNVRRGGEVVGGQGGQAPAYAFATLYRLRKWAHSQCEEAIKAGQWFSCGDSLDRLFG